MNGHGKVKVWSKKVVGGDGWLLFSFLFIFFVFFCFLSCFIFGKKKSHWKKKIFRFFVQGQGSRSTWKKTENHRKKWTKMRKVTTHLHLPPFSIRPWPYLDLALTIQKKNWKNCIFFVNSDAKIDRRKGKKNHFYWCIPWQNNLPRRVAPLLEKIGV